MIITYCSNVHPLIDLKGAFEHLKGDIFKVAQNFTKEKPLFPLGFWLPEKALDELEETSRFNEFVAQLNSTGVEICTFNAFPQSVFHNQSVKEKVYDPDWSRDERLCFTQKVAELAAKLGRDEIVISTLSGGFLPNDNEEKRGRYLDSFVNYLGWAQRFENERGVCVKLALEPEPFNTLQDENDCIEFYQKIIGAAKASGWSKETVRRYLGICLDTCHFSVRFREPLAAHEQMTREGVPVFKIQVSVAPRWSRDMGEAALQEFWDLHEPVYLHQSYAKDEQGRVHAFVDLDQAKASGLEAVEWRTHFHVPIHWGDRPQTTGGELISFLKALVGKEEIPILEVETYSFGALRRDGSDQMPSLSQSIIAELEWLGAFFR